MSTKSPVSSSGIRDNHLRGKVADFLIEKISEESELSVVSAYFTIYAYEALAEQLDQISNLRFLFGEPSFITSLDPDKTDKKSFKFEKVRNKLWLPENDAIRPSKLQIKLIVELFNNETECWKPVHRVQSFLNEAQLTRIAIGIRIGALRTRVQTTDFKILVLDDMLISLDMSNRMPIVKMILNKDNDPDLRFFDQFQKITLTHDKGFYELIKRHTSPNQWEYYNFHAKEEENSQPRIKRDRTSLEKAQAYLADGEYEACGSEIRKEAELVLHKYIKGLNGAAEDGVFVPLSSKLNQAFKQVTENSRRDFNKLFVKKDLPLDLIKKLQTDFINDDLLTVEEVGELTKLKNELIAYLIKQYELNENKSKLIEETQDILKRVMNPASHASLVPLYEAELKEAITGVKQLQEHLNAES